jgi:hypothetical protein
VIFLPGYRWVKFGREPRGAVLGCLEKMMREMGDLDGLAAAAEAAGDRS